MRAQKEMRETNRITEIEKKFKEFSWPLSKRLSESRRESYRSELEVVMVAGSSSG